MSLRQIKPTTPGRRGMTTQDFSEITVSRPLKSLLAPKIRRSGRNNQGRITTRHKGGGAKRFYRLVNFNLPFGTEAVVEHIEYDPNRSARIARIKDQSGQYHYALAVGGLKVGHTIRAGEEVAIAKGNRLPLANIPIGSVVHAVELQPGKGAQLVRAAGAGAQLIARDGPNATLKLPSGEVRTVNSKCAATLGSIGNEQHQNIKYGKAGRSRRRGIRPTVRGVVMNAVDHPHGGGEGKHGTGGRYGRSPKTPWGQKTLGHKTRRRKSSSKFIVKSRHVAKRK